MVYCTVIKFLIGCIYLFICMSSQVPAKMLLIAFKFRHLVFIRLWPDLIVRPTIYTRDKANLGTRKISLQPAVMLGLLSTLGIRQI